MKWKQGSASPAVVCLYLVKHLKALLDHTTALVDLLSQHGFYPHHSSATRLGICSLSGYCTTLRWTFCSTLAPRVRSSIFPIAGRKAFRHATLASSEAEPEASRWRYMRWMVRRCRWMVALFTVTASTLSILHT